MPVSLPNVPLNIIPATQDTPTEAQKVLVVGQMLTGTATAGQVERNVGDSNLEINALFGQRSHVAGIVRRFKGINTLTQLDVLPLVDAGSAVKATSTITFTGSPTENGRLFISFGSQNDHRYAIDLTTGQTPTEIGSAVTALFSVDMDSPFVVTNTAGVVTATASNGGTLGNEFAVRVEGSVSGVTVAIVGWANGATDPSLTAILDAIGSERYQTVLWPSNYDLTVIESLLNNRFNASNDVLDGVVCQVKQDTLNNLKTFANQNSQSVWITGYKNINEDSRKGNFFFEMPDIMAAVKCALRSLRLTSGSNLTQYLTTVAPADQFGGDELASLPYFNTLLPDVTVPLAADEWSFEDQDELETAGVSVDGPNQAYNNAILGEQVTTYLTDVAGNSDDSYHFLNTVDTASKVREYFVVNAKRKYAQARLTDGDLGPRRDMANAASIRAFFNELYQDLAQMVLVQSGAAAQRDFDENMLITVDVRNGQVTVDSSPLLVSQLRAVLGTIAINFGG